MSVSSILDEIENLVVDGKHIVFTNKSIIEEGELIRLVDDLRNELPLELQNAAQIMQTKDAIIDEARTEAERIIKQARESAERLIEESAVVRQSQEKAELIMEQVRAQEQEINERAVAQAQSLSANAKDYATHVFEHLVVNVESALTVLQQARAELEKMSAESIQPQVYSESESEA